MARDDGGNSKARRRSGFRTAQAGGRRSIGTKRTASGVGVSRSNAFSTDASFVVCVNPHGNDDLQARRIYQVVPDASAAKSRFLRVVDDSGDDYLYPESCFAPISLTKAVKEALQA